MSEYKTYTLDSSAIDYIQETMDTCGLSLAKHVLKKLNLEAGQVTTALPPEGDIDYIENFSGGGIMPDPPKSGWKKFDDGSVAVPLLRIESYALDTIRSFLSGGSARICVFENLTANPTNAWLKDSPSPWGAFKHEIYHFLIGGGHAVQKIRRTISWATMNIPLIGVLTSLPSADHSFFTDNKLTLEIIETLAEGTEQLVVGAYDREGYLVWERTPSK